MSESRESLSEQSRRRTSWILSILGLIVLILFVTVMCSMRQKKEVVVQQQPHPAFVVQPFAGNGDDDGSLLPDFGVRDAQLVITPSEVDLSQVVLGAQAEAVLVLRAENAPLLLLQKYLAEAPEGGFMLSGSCMEKTQLEENEECLLKVSWTPTVVQTIQNTLTLVWREDNPRVLRDERTQIQLKASSTDSKECVCCELEKEKDKKVPRRVVDAATGVERELQEGEQVIGEVIVDEQGNVVAIVEPERVALGLKNEYLGRVTDRRTVETADGTILGRLLGDDTLVDPDFNVLGAAVPLVSVLDAQGVVIGKMIADNDGVRVVDAEGTVLGTPRVDKSVVDKAGLQIGMLRDWGAALDLSGDYMGVILPTGAVLDKDSKIVGYIQQNGFVTSDSGVLVGGVVPKGAAVGTGCRSYGTVSLTGQVKDSYGQVIGRVMLDGGVVDTNFNEIGSVVNQGLIVNMKGDVLGFVNSEGKGVDGNGALIGCVAPNGMVSAGKTVLGGVMQKGYVSGESCGVVGSVYPDARVMSLDVREVGKVRADGYVVNGANKLIGSVVPHGTVLAESCRLAGVISVTGQVVNPQNMSVGCIDMHKKAVNVDGQEIGKITPTGAVLAADGSLIGRSRYDGRIVDRSGKIVDCVSADDPSVSAKRGVVLDENGMPTGWTALAGRCYDDRNEEVGSIAFNGWVSDKEGRLVGFMPSDGAVISFDGKVLGHYNQLMGTSVDLQGETFGRVMPDGTVLDAEGRQVLGALVPQNAAVVDLMGSLLGEMTREGQVVNSAGQSVGRVFADGAVYNAENALIGGVISSGVVLSAAGNQIGFVNATGDVLSKGTRIASLLPNGLAVTPDNRVLGRLWDRISVVVSASGIVGPVVPRATASDSSAYQAAVYDKNGMYIGLLSGYGTLLTADGRLGGMAVPVGMVVNPDHRLIGWVGFRGQVLNGSGQVLGQVGQGGMAFNSAGSVIGTVVPKGTVIDARGAYIGRVGGDGGVYNASGAVGLFVDSSPYLFNADKTVSARVLTDGIALSSKGQMLGWTDFSGSVMNSDGLVGRVSLENLVADSAGQVVASYIPLGAPSVQEDEKMCGVVAENGSVVSAAGRVVGTVLAPDYTVQKNAVVGRIRARSLFVNHLTRSEAIGFASLDGIVYHPNTSRQVGTVMMNGLMVDSAQKVIGGVVDNGFAIASNLKPLGNQDYTGSVWLGGKVIASTSGIGLVMQGDSLLGGIFKPELIVDKNGLEIGRSDALSNVVDQSGKKIASRMAFYTALTPETIWAGGPVRTGAVVDDYARKVGVVAGDSLVMSDSSLRGRVLSDGSVAGVPERSVYNSMPYAGHLVTQGLPVGYNQQVLGRTTVNGDLIDASGAVIFQELDDATILGKEHPLEGMVLSFRPAVSYHDTLLGMMTGDGKIVSDGENFVGNLAANGAVVTGAASDENATNKLKEEGGLIPDTLITDDACRVIGQTFYDGTVVNGMGNVVGRVQPTLMATDPQGKVLGHSVRFGPITTFDSRGIFLGRTLSDSTVVDPDGVLLGCARIDKIVVDANGNELGRLRDRGPVFSERKMVGRVDAMGRVVGLEGEVIGVIGGRDSDDFYDLTGVKRGFMASKEQRLLLNPDGTLDKLVDRDGWVIDGATGEKLFRIDQATGNMYDRDGHLIGTLGDEADYVYLYDMQNKIVGRLVGCELQKIPGNEPMGTVLANGDVRDPNNEVILTTTADGKVYNLDGTQYGRFAGVGLDLRRCGLSTARIGTSRKIPFNNKTYDIDPNTGLITDPDTQKPVGMWNPETNQPYIWDPAAISEPTRTPPPPPKGITIPPEAIQNVQDLQKKRRAMMKDKMTSQPAIIPGPEILARAKGHKDKDWSGVGVGKNNISTWPVDMTHVLLADKAIPAVLVRSIDSRYPSVPVTAIVERHIYSEEGRNVLIPAGSRLIGSLEGSGMDFGNDQAAKLDISWKRLIRPDGAAFKFEAVTGDAQGRGGAAAYLDLQLLKKLGLPFLSTVGQWPILKLTEMNEKNSVASTTTNANGGTTSQTAGSQTREAFIDNFKDMWDTLMEMAGAIPNVLYVPSGTRITAFSNEDLWLRSVEDDEDALKEQGFGNPLNAILPQSNGSWTKERAKDREGGSSAPDSRQGGEVPNEEVLYTPEDIPDRVIEPVSAPDEQPPAYF